MENLIFMENDGYGKNVRNCGDAVEFYLMAKKEQLTSISYDIQGCFFFPCLGHLTVLWTALKGKPTLDMLNIGQAPVIHGAHSVFIPSHEFIQRGANELHFRIFLLDLLGNSHLLCAAGAVG